MQVSYKVPSKHTWPLYGGPPDKGLRANTRKVNIATLKTNSSLLPLSLKKLSSLHYSRIRFNPKCRWAFSKSDIRIATLTPGGPVSALVCLVHIEFPGGDPRRWSTMLLARLFCFAGASTSKLDKRHSLGDLADMSAQTRCGERHTQRARTHTS